MDISIIAELLNGVITRIFPDKTAQAAAQLELQKLQLSGELQQMADQANMNSEQARVDEAEAASGNKFEQDWRPLCGYVCAFGLAWIYLLQPFLIFTLTCFGKQLPQLPVLDIAQLMTLLLGLLGLGGMRSYETVNGGRK